jgi:hypothetical protein
MTSVGEEHSTDAIAGSQTKVNSRSSSIDSVIVRAKKKKRDIKK